MPNRSLPLSRKDYRHLARQHVLKAAEWGHSAGTDFWLVFNSGLDILAAADTATGDELAENGWTATSLVNTAGSGADFGSSSDKGTPGHALTNASGDLLNSPAIFGDWTHMEMARRLVGASILPRKLVAEFMGAMTVHSADEPRSGWGFIEDGGSAATEADQLAFISSDGTNFQLGANAGTPVNLIADDANWHLWKIELDVDSGYARVSQDGVLLSTTTALSVAITADEAPYKFGFHALTTNRPALGLTHIYYSWE